MNSDLSRPENRSERQYHKLLEVYLGLRASNRTRPVRLELAQIPLAVPLARKIRRGLREREELLQRGIEAPSSSPDASGETRASIRALRTLLDRDRVARLLRISRRTLPKQGDPREEPGPAERPSRCNVRSLIAGPQSRPADQLAEARGGRG